MIDEIVREVADELVSSFAANEDAILRFPKYHNKAPDSAMVSEQESRIIFAKILYLM